MGFWVRRVQPTKFYIADLGDKGVEGSGGEVDLRTSFSYDDIQSSVSLAAAFVSADLVKLDGPGGSPVVPGTEFEDSVQPHFHYMKSGVLIPGDFSGTPKKATVTFGTNYADTSYSIQVSPIMINDATYSLSIESKTVSGFVVNLNSNNIASLVEVGWKTTPTGE